MVRQVSAKVVPRKNGIILLGQAGEVSITATITVRDQRRIYRQSMATVRGLRVFAAAKLITEAATNRFLVAVQQELYWEGRQIWSVIDPLVGSRAIYSYPEKVFSFPRDMKLDGAWVLQSSIAVVSMESLPELGRDRFLQALQYNPLGRMEWYIYHNELLVTPTGERRPEVPRPRQDVVVDMNDI